MAAIVALEALKEHCEVVLSTDSQYVRQGITQWIHNWKKRGWKTAEKKAGEKMSTSGSGWTPRLASIKLNGNG